jgi:Zn-finger nucleic acid-binding protein
MVCPHDQVPLSAQSHKSVTLDICEHCGGVWVDGGEFEKLTLHFSAPELHDGQDIRSILPLSSAPGLTPAKDFWQEDTLLCPHGHGALFKHYFAGTTIGLDHCHACKGYWLGGAELRAVAEAVGPNPHEDAMGRFILSEVTFATKEDRNDPRVPDRFEDFLRNPAQLLWTVGSGLLFGLLR